MKDVTGQNVLYMAALLGNYKMVDAILKYKVRAVRIKVRNDTMESWKFQFDGLDVKIIFF